MAPISPANPRPARPSRSITNPRTETNTTPPPHPLSDSTLPATAPLDKTSISALGSRVAHYRVPGSLLKKGTYKLVVRLRGRTEPIYFMNFVSSTTEMKRTEKEWVTDTHAYAVAFDVH